MLTPIQKIVDEIRQEIPTLSISKALLEMQGKPSVMIDVREPAEALESPVAHSLNIPRGVLEMKVLADFPDEKMAIYLHCASGVRANIGCRTTKAIRLPRC